MGKPSKVNMTTEALIQMKNTTRLIGQVVDEIHSRFPDLYDPSLNRDFEIRINVTVVEALAIVAMSRGMGNDVPPFNKFNIFGDPIEQEDP